MSYCKFAPDNPIHEHYHAKEYGFPVSADNVLFERLALEINQAGLSWELMLKKRAAFNRAFKDFDVEKVARFGARDIFRLLNDAGIVRNRLKVEAVIHNAKVIKDIEKEHGSFASWLDMHFPELQDVKEATKLFKKQGFKFIGGEVMKEFLQSVGVLPAPHDKNCPVMKDIFKARVLRVVSSIQKGETMTYGEVAKRAGSPRAARAVGAIMKQNKDKKIPCHRVVASKGLGGYNGLRGPDKAALLKRERLAG